MKLTDRQLSVYEYILHHHQETGMAPTVREICEHFESKGPAGVHRILHVLIEKGFIESIRGKKRSWRPTAVAVESKCIPLAGRIAAGTPIGVFDHVEAYLPIDPALYGHEACFAVRVVGDSMIEAHIQEGDLAVIAPRDDVDNGAIAAVIVDEMLPEATLKIIRRKRASLNCTRRTKITRRSY